MSGIYELIRRDGAKKRHLLREDGLTSCRQTIRNGVKSRTYDARDIDCTECLVAELTRPA